MINGIRHNFDAFKLATRGGGGVKQPQNTRVKVCYTNDGHGNTDKMSAVMEAMKNFDALNADCVTLKLSGGDNVSGADVEKNSVCFDILDNVMGIDASVLGNHEFDSGIDGLVKAAKSKNIKFVATNVEFDDIDSIKDVVKKSIIIEEKGQKFGIVGAMPLDFKSCTKKSVQDGIEVMDFDDSVEAIQEEIDNLKNQGVNKIILLSHSSYETDKQYAQNLEHIDIIVGGHSHTVVQGAKEGENVLKSKSGEPVIVVQAGENGKYYGVLDVEFDKEGKLVKISNNLTQVSAKKSPNIEYIKQQKLGVSPSVGTIKEIEELPPNRRIKPHAWANLVVDSMKTELGADVAFINAANVRKVPAQGGLTERDVVESVPMKNRLIKTTVTQKQMVEAISQAALQTLGSNDGEPGLLFASGITYKIDDKGNLLEMNFIDKKGTKTQIDIKNPSETVTYSAIYDDFTMRADGEYPALAPKFAVQYFDYDKDKTTIDYISKMANKDNLNLSDDKRLEIVQTSQPQPLNSNNRKFLDLTLPKAS